jgi:hypothetical protein
VPLLVQAARLLRLILLPEPSELRYSLLWAAVLKTVFPGAFFLAPDLLVVSLLSTTAALVWNLGMPIYLDRYLLGVCRMPPCSRRGYVGTSAYEALPSERVCHQ